MAKLVVCNLSNTMRIAMTLTYCVAPNTLKKTRVHNKRVDFETGRKLQAILLTVV